MAAFRAIAFSCAALLATLGAAFAQATDALVKSAMGEVASELQECSIYFLTVSVCLGTQEPALARRAKEQGEKIGGLAVTIFRNGILSDEAILARDRLFTKAMTDAMQGNCTNIAVLLQRYAKFCQQLSQDADPRLKEWIECFQAGRERSCGGPGLPVTPGR